MLKVRKFSLSHSKILSSSLFVVETSSTISRPNLNILESSANSKNSTYWMININDRSLI